MLSALPMLVVSLLMAAVLKDARSNKRVKDRVYMSPMLGYAMIACSVFVAASWMPLYFQAKKDGFPLASNIVLVGAVIVLLICLICVNAVFSWRIDIDGDEYIYRSFFRKKHRLKFAQTELTRVNLVGQSIKFRSQGVRISVEFNAVNAKRFTQLVLEKGIDGIADNRFNSQMLMQMFEDVDKSYGK